MMQSSLTLTKELQQLQQEMIHLSRTIAASSSAHLAWWQEKKREKNLKQQIAHLRNTLEQDLIA